MRVIPLLREGNGGHNIDLLWHGKHRNELIKGGPFAIDDTAELKIRPVSYSDSE